MAQSGLYLPTGVETVGQFDVNFYPKRGWNPLSARKKNKTANVTAVLVDGVPSWLAQSIYTWLLALEKELGDRLENGQVIARMLRQPIRTNSNLGTFGLLDYPVGEFWRTAEPDLQLDIIDALLTLGGGVLIQTPAQSVFGPVREPAAKELEHILSTGGSMWRSNLAEPFGLARRVDEAMEATVTSLSQSGLDAGAAIGTAWMCCYRRNPNYDEAYRHLVLAVEAALLPITIPRDSVGTLGKAINHIKATKEKWSVGGLDNGGTVLIEALDTIWKNQERHAQPDGSIRGVTAAETEAALYTAVTIVSWRNANLITKTA